MRMLFIWMHRLHAEHVQLSTVEIKSLTADIDKRPSLCSPSSTALLTTVLQADKS